jgi:anhydro-N-acetylmuramic acid kinase
VVALGLMSGTSLDGIDAAIITTDGRKVLAIGPAVSVPYPAAFRSRLRRLLGRATEAGDQAVIDELTDRHAQVVERLAQGTAVDLVGFHGQTVLHAPAPAAAGRPGVTLQVGDPCRLARRLGRPVVCDFRQADVAAGGEGAPLVPLYHAALACDLARPLAVLNLGGVGNLTWIGGDADGEAGLVACDTGPGNALLDDWLARTTGAPFDAGGRLAAAGRIDAARLDRWLADPFFGRPAPKSLDRDAFRAVLADLAGGDGRPSADAADGAATLAAFTAAAVARAVALLPAPPRRWLVGGGGRHNRTLMRLLAERLGVPVEPVEAVGWRGDVLEAEAFAFLAVRSLQGLALSLPTTTGVPRPQPGGRLVLPEGGPVSATA